MDKIDDINNGFYACVYQKNNKIIIVYRGSDDKKDWFDSDKDMLLGKIPTQAQNALDVYDMVSKFCKDNDMKPVVVGYSLGGSLAQIIGAMRDAESVTFNAYGVRNFLPKNFKNYNECNVINYCNDRDILTKSNAENHVGKCYKVSSKNNFGVSHYLENMDSLYEREETTGFSLQNQQIHAARIQEELKKYKDFGKNIIFMPGLYTGDKKTDCTGSYPVSGYERKDGTKVQGYVRECFKHGNPQAKPPREKYKGLKLNQLPKEQLNELMDDLL